VVASGEFSLALMEFWKLIAKFDFSQVEKPGRYRLVWSGGQSSWFPIGSQVFKDYWQLTLDQFIPFEMCHIAVDLGDGLRAHAACHLDDAVQARPDKVGPDGYIAYEEDTSPGTGNPIPLAVGGWHDAGDYDLNMPAQAFVTHKLALAWEEFAPQRDANSLNKEARRFSFDQPNGRPDLLEQVEWGNNGYFLATLFDSYWLSEALPDQIAFHEALPSAYWLFGLHPLNDFTFLFGTGLPEPRYLYSGPLLKRFGSQPASIPGAVVPGISRYDPSRILAYRDIPGEYRNGEACIYDAAVAVFVLLALESLV